MREPVISDAMCIDYTVLKTARPCKSFELKTNVLPR